MRFLKLIGLSFALLVASGVMAQTLTPAQRNTLRTAILAEPAIAADVAIRNDVAISEWCNSAGATDAWMSQADARTLFEAGDVTKYDALTAGKRASWDRMERNAPLDFGRNKLRSAVVDVWGTADSVAVLQTLREKATNCQAKIGGTSKTTNTVTAIDRAWSGRLSVNEISDLLNVAQ